MTITGGSSLPKDEIDRMIKEAEAHSAEDKQRRDEAEVRNGAEQAVYRIEKLLKDNAEKLPEDVVAPVKESLEHLKKANEGEDIEAYQDCDERTGGKKAQAIGQALYAHAQENESAPADRCCCGT
ncbi:Heat shock protein 70 [Mobiluncus curtisii]|uniref:Heat shock protein 70 n=1 Tax=Mobiluncus curtisii TaxID=2051 RepID=A0A2X3BLD2_9ACTO|nr:Heat shock protein 70 [Mobiluncus curtisii]